ncbi:hypothetical protein EKK58_08680 [Candidatus Dependentiae bacterium]|nr:MAG: hypothetical protein EKK58_08680 [Candidatus Dependentiae bacterium]
MKLKTCPGCGRVKTTRNSKLIGREAIGVKEFLWFNCLEKNNLGEGCNSTFVIAKANSIK